MSEPVESPSGAGSGSPDPARPAIDPRIEQLNEGSIASFTASIRHLIDRRLDGIHYAETRRAQLVVAGAAIAAGGLAGLSLAKDTQGLLHGAALGAGIAAIAVGLITWGLYFIQINPKYGFVGPSETRKWFYHHALPNKDALAPPTFKMLFSPRKRAEKSAAYPDEYRSQFELFKASQVPMLADSKANASEDLKQLFLLHVNELTKNRQLSQLRTVLSWGILAVLAGGLIGGALGLVLDDGDGSTIGGRGPCQVLSASGTPTARTAHLHSCDQTPRSR